MPMQLVLETLVVCGDADEGNRIADMLRGSPVRCVATLAEALAALNEEAGRSTPEAVIVDLDLPDCRGMACIRRLRAASRDVALVALAEGGDEKVARDCLAAGAQSFLRKDEVQQSLVRRATEFSVIRMRESAARSRIDTLREQLQQAQRLESLGMMAAGIAHDLNNTLQPIMMMLPLLDRAASDPATREQLSIIREATTRARELVKEVVAVSRPAEGNALEKVALDTLVGDVATMLTAGLPPQIELELEVRPISPIQANQGLLYQIVLNLVTNAAQAIGDASGTIRLTTDEPTDEPHVLLAIADDGPGMTEETQRLIFEPYFTTREESGGSGLGLSVVRSAVHNMRGEITVESAPGAGTRFEIRFPAIQSEDRV